MDADVIVIGAGAAGLSAARDLAAGSLRVIVVEARDRVGGRVCSRPTKRTAIRAELGAEFIHGRAEETMAILSQAGLAAIEVLGETWASTDGGLQCDPDEDRSVAGIFEGARALQEDESVDEFLGRFESDEAMRRRTARARAFVEGFDAADPSIASARGIAHELSSGVDSRIARPLGGYAPLFDYLHDQCTSLGVEVRTSTAVRRVSWRTGKISIEATNGSGELVHLHARAAVVTLPVGVLRHDGDHTAVLFDPPLPESKKRALRSIEMGHVVKVALLFRTDFWTQICGERYRDAAFFRSENAPFPTFWAQFPARGELIVAWAGGPKAIAMRALSEAELIDRALVAFGSLLREPSRARDEFESGFVHRWTHDPFARGAYSYLAVGAGDARQTLAAPVDDTLFFAGEATSYDGQSGTVNGALRTGARAAKEVRSKYA